MKYPYRFSFFFSEGEKLFASFIFMFVDYSSRFHSDFWVFIVEAPCLWVFCAKLAMLKFHQKCKTQLRFRIKSSFSLSLSLCLLLNHKPQSNDLLGNFLSANRCLRVLDWKWVAHRYIRYTMIFHSVYSVDCTDSTLSKFNFSKKNSLLWKQKILKYLCG